MFALECFKHNTFYNRANSVVLTHFLNPSYNPFYTNNRINPFIIVKCFICVLHVVLCCRRTFVAPTQREGCATRPPTCLLAVAQLYYCHSWSHTKVRGGNKLNHDACKLQNVPLRICPACITKRMCPASV